MSTRLLRGLFACEVFLLTFTIAYAQDNWNGGTGTWSNPGKWSQGVLPSLASDVTINSVGSDFVTLDTPGFAKSLTLGGTYNTSELTDGGVAQTLTIANSLYLRQGGYLDLTGGTALTAGADSINAGYVSLSNGSKFSVTGNLDNSYGITTLGGGSQVNVTGTLTNEAGGGSGLSNGDVWNVGTLVNRGNLYIGSGATMNLTNQPGGITDLPSGSAFQVMGSFNDLVNSASAFAHLTSIEGEVLLGNSQTTNITPGGSPSTLSNSGLFALGNNSTANVNGNLNNLGDVYAGFYVVGGTGSTLDVSGTFTNNQNAVLVLYDSGDIVNVGALNNSGWVRLNPGETLNLTNQPGGITSIPYGGGFEVQGNVNDLVDSANGFVNLTTLGGSLEMQNGQTTTITPNGGVLTLNSNYAVLDAGNNSTIKVNGNVNNSGLVSTGRYYYDSIGSTLNISGTLTNNNPNSTLYLSYAGDVANIGSLVNNGSVFISTGATLKLTNQLNVTDLPANALYYIFGIFNNAGLNSPFGGLTTMEGQVFLANGQTVDITPSIGALTLNYCCGRLDVSNGSTVNVKGDLVNDWVLSTNSYYNGSPSTISVTGTLTNNGSLYLSQGSNLNAGNVVNNVYLEQIPGSDNNGNNIITGTLTNNGNIQQFDYYASQNTRIMARSGVVNNGTIYQSGYTGLAFIQTPRLDNSGTITQVNNTVLGDTILVGTGTAGAAGYYQLANGTLGESVNMSSFGVIDIQNRGLVTLAGTLDILLQSGFNPAVGSTYEFITFTPGDLSGVFSNIQNAIFNAGTEKWTVVYGNSGGYVELLAQSNSTTTPEPGSFLLLGTGLLGLAYGIRGRYTR